MTRPPCAAMSFLTEAGVWKLRATFPLLPVPCHVKRSGPFVAPGVPARMSVTRPLIVCDPVVKVGHAPSGAGRIGSFTGGAPPAPPVALVPPVDGAPPVAG